MSDKHEENKIEWVRVYEKPQESNPMRFQFPFLNVSSPLQECTTVEK